MDSLCENTGLDLSEQRVLAHVAQMIVTTLMSNTGLSFLPSKVRLS